MTNGSLRTPQVLLFKTTASECSATYGGTLQWIWWIKPFPNPYLRVISRYLNTAIDRSRVYDYPHFQCTLKMDLHLFVIHLDT